MPTIVKKVKTENSKQIRENILPYIKITIWWLFVIAWFALVFEVALGVSLLLIGFWLLSTAFTYKKRW